MQKEKSTLLLRFAAPLQSWGSSSRFTVRMSEREPTKSAVIGLLAAALGRRREDSIDDLKGIKFGVRIDQPGKFISDYQTAKTDDGRQSFVSHRHYVSDAVYLVGIEESLELLDVLQKAVRKPAYPLFLGRRSCPPTGIIVLGIRGGCSLEDALGQESWQASSWFKAKYGDIDQLDTIIDADVNAVGAFVKNDTPLSFDQGYRRYARRSMVRFSVDIPREDSERELEHDPMGVF